MEKETVALPSYNGMIIFLSCQLKKEKNIGFYIL